MDDAPKIFTNDVEDGQRQSTLTNAYPIVHGSAYRFLQLYCKYLSYRVIRDRPIDPCSQIYLGARWNYHKCCWAITRRHHRLEFRRRLNLWSSSSSFSAILHAKGWRRVVSLSNYHNLPLLQPLRWSSSQSIRRCHLSNTGVVDQGFCTLVHTLERFPSPDFSFSTYFRVVWP